MLLNDFLQKYVSLKIDSEPFVENFNLDELSTLKKAEGEKKLYELLEIGNEESGKVYYCLNKIKYQEKDSILITFSIELNGTRNGTSKSGRKVMNVLDSVCKVLKSVDYQKCYMYNIENKKNIALLKIIKIINEQDML